MLTSPAAVATYPSALFSPAAMVRDNGGVSTLAAMSHAEAKLLRTYSVRPKRDSRRPATAGACAREAPAVPPSPLSLAEVRRLARPRGHSAPSIAAARQRVTAGSGSDGAPASGTTEERSRLRTASNRSRPALTVNTGRGEVVGVPLGGPAEDLTVDLGASGSWSVRTPSSVVSSRRPSASPSPVGSPKMRFTCEEPDSGGSQRRLQSKRGTVVRKRSQNVSKRLPLRLIDSDSEDGGERPGATARALAVRAGLTLRAGATRTSERKRKEPNPFVDLRAGERRQQQERSWLTEDSVYMRERCGDLKQHVKQWYLDQRECPGELLYENSLEYGIFVMQGQGSKSKSGHLMVAPMQRSGRQARTPAGRLALLQKTLGSSTKRLQALAADEPDPPAPTQQQQFQGLALAFRRTSEVQS